MAAIAAKCPSEASATVRCAVVRVWCAERYVSHIHIIPRRWWRCAGNNPIYDEIGVDSSVRHPLSLGIYISTFEAPKALMLSTRRVRERPIILFTPHCLNRIIPMYICTYTHRACHALLARLSLRSSIYSVPFIILFFLFFYLFISLRNISQNFLI